MENKNMIYCPGELPKKTQPWVFLMGPIQGAPEWQEAAAKIFERECPEVLLLNPRRKNNPKGNEDEKKVFNDKEYTKQVEWETMGLRLADVIVCWIPTPAEEIPGRQYAQTTRFELGENLARGKQVFLGCAKDTPGQRYFQQKLVDYHQPALTHSLPDLALAVKNWVEMKKSGVTTWFTSDTHFGSMRALELSQRPFLTVKDMDITLMENWNKKISPYDDVFVLGDFGDNSFLNLLNGRKMLVKGNYEEEGKDEVKEENWDEINPDDVGIIFDQNIQAALVLAHKPLTVKRKVEELRKQGKSAFGLFGHIHGRQKIKAWGMDVGVDANNFFPVNLDEVERLYGVVEDGYYDEEVWS